MAYQIEPANCDDDELLATKLDCLRLFQSIMRNDGAQNSEIIIADAQKFWDFLVGPAETPDDE